MAVKITQVSQGNVLLQLCLQYDPPVQSRKTGMPVSIEELKIGIYRTPTSVRMKAFNQDNLERAEKIRQFRMGQIKRGELTVMNSPERKDFVTLYRNISHEKEHNYTASYSRFVKFCGGTCPYDRIDAAFFIQYRDYLLDATKEDAVNPLSMHTAAQYFNQFRYVLREAFYEGHLKEDLHDCAEIIKVERDYDGLVTMEEIQRLMKVPCENPLVPKMCWFLAVTGVRYGFLAKLRWENVIVSPDRRPYIVTKVQRSGREELMHITPEALGYLGRRKKSGQVFPVGGKDMRMHLRKWLHAAGVREELSFESFRLGIQTLNRRTSLLKAR